MKSSVLFAAALAASAAFVAASGRPVAAKSSPVCAACVKANMERLAGDDLRGRGCGSADENAASRFIVDILRRSKIDPAFGKDGYLQAVQLLTPTPAAPPTLTVTKDGQQVTLLQGRDMIAFESPVSLDAPLVVVTDSRAAADVVKGKVVVFDTPIQDLPGVQILLHTGAAAVIAPANDQISEHWDELAARPPGRTQITGVPPHAGPALGVSIFAKPDAMKAVRGLAGGEARLDAPRGPPKERTTYNVLGVLHGTAPDADRHALLLTAHYDHLGVRNGVIFHGANDDASGTSAVLEFARILGSSKRNKRTVYFGLFGCEEEGELGAQYFLGHAPMATSDLMANLEFEMIGVDDPQRPGALMLTGWERTNLGPALQAHGAHVGPDLYPQQHFFQRSDNYQLALKGVVAQTVSAWPVPPTYHAASDDLAHVDLKFMDTVIGSMVEPVTWLLNSDFQPAWLEGQKP
ncbi:MAG TPA: M28 family peptidase [Phenylobacterium sp.]|uniref:M28 family metallopeptidase n=1 Tax=Phenylobacterium sp. TaxID=1871053 RepID=UPI002D643EF3|nr:M28 family peptidase [Phenylobacterium sp.]HZZ67211.1 M28 family peptidase [Phenylobacterium sp.]